MTPTLPSRSLICSVYIDLYLDIVSGGYNSLTMNPTVISAVSLSSVTPELQAQIDVAIGIVFFGQTVGSLSDWFYCYLSALRGSPPIQLAN